MTEQLLFAAGADIDSARRWIGRLGLDGLGERRPAALSLGQQQRVAFARALLRPADLVLLDEPFSALDAPLRMRLRRMLLELQGEIDATMILVTHDPLEAALLADELLVIDRGRALQEGRTRDVFGRPANETVARLLGCDTVAEGVVADHDRIAIGGGVALRVGDPPLRPGARVGWSFAPARAQIGAGGAYRGVVEQVTPMGISSQIAVRIGDALVRITGARAPFAEGDAVRFDLDPEAVQVWPIG